MVGEPHKFLKYDPSTGLPTQEAFMASSAGAGDAGKGVCLDTAGKIAENMMPAGVSADTKVMKAGTAGVTANDVVYAHLVTAVLTADKADATDSTKRAQGYVKDTVNPGDDVTVYFDGTLPGTGLTPGARYYATLTPGTISASPPTAAGNMVQCVGEAKSATELKFDPDRSPIILVS